MLYRITLAAALAAPAAAQGKKTADLAAACAKTVADNHGCSTFCGYEAVYAGSEWICVPGKVGMESPPLPFPSSEDDKLEYCTVITANNRGCCDVCGYRWDEAAGHCSKAATPMKKVPRKASDTTAAPIIGGQGDYRYQYMPDLLQAPAGASLVNCHGWALDKDNNIYLTYQNDGKDPNCLIRWNPDGTGGTYMTGGNTTLCSGTPHGLKITTEGDTQFLYHANNNQKLTKTHLDGTIVWQVNGFFGQATKEYRPTWFATPPGSETIYLCDGYGSNNVYAFDRDTGKFLNKTWGGHTTGAKGPDAAHGTFSTNHGCTFDSRLENDTIIVSDRANSRFEFFNFNPAGHDTFEYYKTVNFEAMMGAGTLPCNIRMYPDQDGRSIVPDLAGPVAVMDDTNKVISVVNVSVLLEQEQHKHPHDAVFLPNGDMLVGTWAPGRVSYWKRLHQ